MRLGNRRQLSMREGGERNKIYRKPGSYGNLLN